MNWTPTSQVLTGPTSDLDSFVMGLNKSSTNTEHDSSLSVAVDNPAQKAVSVTLQRTEAQLIQRTLYACVGQGLQGEALLCWCARGNDQARGGRTHLRSAWSYAEYLLCMLKHYTKGSIYAFVYFALQCNLYRLEETETMEVKYSGWGFSCMDPIKVNGSCTTKSLCITQWIVSNPCTVCLNKSLVINSSSTRNKTHLMS